MQFVRVIPKRNGLRSLLRIISRRNCNDLKKNLAEIIPIEQEKLKELREKYDNVKIGDITIKSLYSGMRGLKLLPTETSQLDSTFGISFRGYTLQQCCHYLPKFKNSAQPLPEGIFWLLCTGKMPTDDQVKFLSNEWAERASLPCHVVNMLDNFPKTLHPMAQLTAAMTALNHDSKFAKAYSNGIPKTAYWEYIYEDAMDLIAKVIVVAATIYVNVYRKGKGKFAVDCDADWTYNFMKMIGYDNNDEFVELMRLYLTIHADHEGGNVSAHTVHLVGSALSDPYLSYAAGMNGLAGPLHGLANQGFLQFLEELIKEISISPTDQSLQDFVLKTLKSGRVIPGYGHADLRATDPRYTVLSEFAQRQMPGNELIKLVAQIFKVVPKILTETGKVKNPWPNVDAHSGVLLYNYGMTEKSFYTVLFAVSRSLGVMASLIWDRVFQLPIERPKSIDKYHLLKLAENKEEDLKIEINLGAK